MRLLDRDREDINFMIRHMAYLDRDATLVLVRKTPRAKDKILTVLRGVDEEADASLTWAYGPKASIVDTLATRRGDRVTAFEF